MFYFRTCPLAFRSDNGNMNTAEPPTSLNAAWAQWVADALAYAKDVHNLTMAEVGDRMTPALSSSTLSKIKAEGRKLEAPEVTELSRVTGYPPPPNLLALVDAHIMTEFIPLRMSVASGIWREESIKVSASPLRVREFHEPTYAGLKQHARLLEDDHADLYAIKGTYLICIDFVEAKSPLNDGNIVVVERLRVTNDGHLIELSVREIARRDGKWFLDSLSSNPALAEPIPYEGETPTLRIRDLVRGAYRPPYRRVAV